MARFHVIIPAAGNGSRMGLGTPKQYLCLNGISLIEHVIKVFDACIKVDAIHIIVNNQDHALKNIYSSVSNKSHVYECGGKTRSATVLNGLNAIVGQVRSDDWVLVHDAARPGLSSPRLRELINTLENDAIGGLLALPLADTLKRSNNENRVSATIPRNDLWQAQTPQMFRYGTLKKALTEFIGIPTDEAEAIEALGLCPKLVMGELQNLKVTYPQDLAILSVLLANSTLKTGL